MKQIQLWNKVVSGDRMALGIIFRTYYDDLFIYGLKFSKDKDLVRDALQELFLKIWKHKQNLNGITEIQPYIFKMFRNQVIDAIRSDGKYIFNGEDHFHDELCEFSAEDFIISRQVNQETRDKLALALKQLSPKQREVIYLRYYHGMDIAAIAGVMQINLQSVRNNIYRAMTTMRQSF